MGSDIDSFPVSLSLNDYVLMGYSQAVRHRTLTATCVGSNPASPAIFVFYLTKYEPLAQLVEHLTFNQRVEGSSPSWLTIRLPFAGVAELADAPDLGSGAARRGGSTPFTRTKYFT